MAWGLLEALWLQPSRVMFGIWGIAWLVGYLSLFITAKDSPVHNPAVWSFIVFGLSIATGIAVTIIHVTRRTQGVQGVSARSGAMYGWAWSIGFIGIYLINAGVEGAGASDEVLALLWNALPVPLVGILYLTGGAPWQTSIMYAFGVWFALFVGALVAHVARRRFAAARGRSRAMHDTDLDPVNHAHARVRIMVTLSTLASCDRIAQPRLQTLLDMTGGNLSTRLRKLEETNYGAVTKTHEGRKPATYLELIAAGRRAFEVYTESLAALLRGA